MTPATRAVYRHSSATATRMGGLARKTWHTYWDWQARRATVRILRSLDTRTLRDIGLTPTEIESVVYGRGGERRHCYYEHWRSRGHA